MISSPLSPLDVISPPARSWVGRDEPTRIFGERDALWGSFWDFIFFFLLNVLVAEPDLSVLISPVKSHTAAGSTFWDPPSVKQAKGQSREFWAPFPVPSHLRREPEEGWRTLRFTGGHGSTFQQPEQG